MGIRAGNWDSGWGFPGFSGYGLGFGHYFTVPHRYNLYSSYIKRLRDGTGIALFRDGEMVGSMVPGGKGLFVVARVYDDSGWGTAISFHRFLYHIFKTWKRKISCLILRVSSIVNLSWYLCDESTVNPNYLSTCITLRTPRNASRLPPSCPPQPGKPTNGMC
jgi:hypothetical protein